MGQPIPAVVALTVAVLIVANDDNQVTRTSSAKPLETINYKGFSAAIIQPQAASQPQQQAHAPNSRYDGGPGEGTRSPPTTPIPPNKPL
jgi:hypothetical protein